MALPRAPTGTRERPNDKEKRAMAATLQEILLAPDTQPQVTADCMKLIEQEVSSKSGVSGTAVKLAYKTARRFASGYLQSTVESLLPDMADKLQPYWADFDRLRRLRVRRLPGQARRRGVRGPALGDRCAGRSLRAAHDLEGVPRRPRRRGQARHGRAAEPRRPRAEVRGLTAHLTGTSSSGLAVASARPAASAPLRPHRSGLPVLAPRARRGQPVRRAGQQDAAHGPAQRVGGDADVLQARTRRSRR